VTPSARLSAAIEILGDMESRKRPSGDALKDWGLGHRFAGAKDRAAIGSLVYDSLRLRAASHFAMGEETPRAALIGALRARGLSLEAIESLFSGEGFAPPTLSEGERRHLEAFSLDGAPANVRGNYPAWLAAAFERAFGADAVAEGAALAERAPLDLRVNTLKASRARLLENLAHLEPTVTPYAPFGLRITPGPEGRGPSMLAEPTYVKGQVEIQDEGSQVTALLAAARPGEQVLDLCAGAGGKTLALAAQMANSGQIYAYDSDGRRLNLALARLERAGVRNVQLRHPRGAQDVLADLELRCDLVFVDAPCTGSGTWRRNPDSKWRMRPGALAERVKDQIEILALAARYVRKGGRIAYVTCSLFCEENEDQVARFLAEHTDFAAVSAVDFTAAAGLPELATFSVEGGVALRLTPRRSGTDGFFFALLRRSEH
jgi:16S rRNA (cytosine967-C5)-methyltransferase